MNNFTIAVRKELSSCKSSSELADKSFELINIIGNILWEANASLETDREAQDGENAKGER